MMSMSFSYIAILNIKDSDYCCIISLIGKNEAITLMRNTDLAVKSGTLSHIKMGKLILRSEKIEIEKINFTAIRLLFFKVSRYRESINT